MSATIIDGKAFAAEVRGRVAEQVARLTAETGITPGLAVVLVGEDPASQVYVRAKGKQTVEVGMHSFEHKLPAETSRGRAAGAGRSGSTPIRRCTASWCSCRCRATSTKTW